MRLASGLPFRAKIGASGTSTSRKSVSCSRPSNSAAALAAICSILHQRMRRHRPQSPSAALLTALVDVGKHFAWIQKMRRRSLRRLSNGSCVSPANSNMRDAFCIECDDPLRAEHTSAARSFGVHQQRSRNAESPVRAQADASPRNAMAERLRPLPISRNSAARRRNSSGQKQHKL